MGPSGPHTLHATFLEASRRLIPDDRAGGAITRAHDRDRSPSRAVRGRDLSAGDR